MSDNKTEERRPGRVEKGTFDFGKWKDFNFRLVQSKDKSVKKGRGTLHEKRRDGPFLSRVYDGRDTTESILAPM